MKKILIFTAIAVLAAGLTSVVLAQRGAGMNGDRPNGWFGSERGGGMGGQFGMLACKDSLGLSDAQMTKIKEVNFTHQNAMIDLRASLKKAELKMKQLAQTGTAGKAEMLAASKEITAAKGKIAEARINHMFDLKSVLTKDQLEKWQKCRMGCNSNCGRGMGHFGDGSGMGKGRFGGHPGMGNPNAPHDPDNCPMKGDGPRDGSGRQGN